MSTAADIDTAMLALTTAIGAHVAGGGDAHKLAGWLVSQLRLSDRRVAAALVLSAGRYVAAPPDRRTFAEMG